jgi:antitoxin PrlF
VRAALRLKEGDEILYAIEGDRVVLTRSARDPGDDPFATFGEWDSDADRRAYGGL